MLTQKKLKHVLNYNPDTGIFTWIRPTSYKVIAGDVAGKKHGNYTRISVNKIYYSAHHLAFLYMTGKLPLNFIRHRNKDASDNRRDNLVITNTKNTRSLTMHYSIHLTPKQLIIRIIIALSLGVFAGVLSTITLSGI